MQVGVSLRAPTPTVSATPVPQRCGRTQRGTIIPLEGDETAWSPGREDSCAVAAVSSSHLHGRGHCPTAQPLRAPGRGGRGGFRLLS